MADFDNLSVKQRVEQFHLRHGDDGIRIGAWVHFSDGALRDVNPMGLLAEPPTDVYECCKLQAQYHEELLNRAVNEFRETKNRLISAASANLNQRLNAPSKEELDKLVELKAIVQTRKEAFEAARQRMHDNRPVWMRQREKAEVSSKETNAVFAKAINEIQI